MLCGIEDQTVVAYGYQTTKKIIYGMGGENVVAYIRLPSPAPVITTKLWNKKFTFRLTFWLKIVQRTHAAQ